MPEPLTSYDVEHAHKSGTTRLETRGRLVTPLARERAKDLGVVLVEGTSPETDEKDPSPHRAERCPEHGFFASSGQLATGIVASALDAAFWRGLAGLGASQTSVMFEPRDGYRLQITDAQGLMLAGNSYEGISQVVCHLVRRFGSLNGAVYLSSDPFAGPSFHLNDWTLLAPVCAEDKGSSVVAWVAATSHLENVGGRAAGTVSSDARSLFEEGVRIPPTPIVCERLVDEHILSTLLANVPEPERVRTRVDRLLAAISAVHQRVYDLCLRVGPRNFRRATKLLTEAVGNRRGATAQTNVPEEPRRTRLPVKGHKPLLQEESADERADPRIALTVWREGNVVFADFGGTERQSELPVNVCLRPQTVMRLTGHLLDGGSRQEPLRDSGSPFTRAILPPGSLVAPREPAATGRAFQVLEMLYRALGPFVCPGHTADYIPWAHAVALLAFSPEHSREAHPVHDRLTVGRAGVSGGEDAEELEATGSLRVLRRGRWLSSDSCDVSLSGQADGEYQFLVPGLLRVLSYPAETTFGGRSIDQPTVELRTLSGETVTSSAPNFTLRVRTGDRLRVCLGSPGYDSDLKHNDQKGA